MKITFVRHGQTENNYMNICNGHKNEFLNETGRRQCHKLRTKIKNKHFDVCYMSPLIRTVETAMILIGDRVEMIPDKRLIDRCLGEFEGKSRDLYDSDKYWDYKLNCSDDSVEPIQDLINRCKSFVDYLFEKYSDESILIVTHSAIIRVLRALILNKSFDSSLLGTDVVNCYFEEINVKTTK